MESHGPIYLTTAEAAAMIGVKEDLFRSLAREFADDWLRPVYMGAGRKKVLRWLREDALCLAHIYKRRQTVPPSKPDQRK